MKVKATFLQNDENNPIKFDEIDLINPLRKRLRGEEVKEGVLCYPVLTGFCGTDFELMHMGQRNELGEKFPEGTKRLINGHEGVVYVPSENRFAVVLIRGGDSHDPTRYAGDETYFEYGCDGADGIMAEAGYFHPDMLLDIPEKYFKSDKLDISIAKKLIFADPYACMLFQLERMEDLGSAHNFRIEMAKDKLNEENGRKQAREKLFDRVVIFGMGTTGMLLGDTIRRKYPKSKVVFVGRTDLDNQKQGFVDKLGAQYIKNDCNTSEEFAKLLKKRLGGKASIFTGCSGSAVESELAFNHEVLDNNGIYNSFSLGPKIELDTMPFGFKNHLLFGSINFRQSHMEEAIKILCESNLDEFVEMIDLEELAKNPKKIYDEKIYSKGSPVKTATIWNKGYLEGEK